MDYISFVDSADIAEHMREIAYEPTGFEAAFLVWRSAYKSLEEKNQAWRQIINDFPDEELERAAWIEAPSSLVSPRIHGASKEEARMLFRK